MHVAASTESPLVTAADTVVVGVFEDEGVAHDLPGGVLQALLDSGEASRAFRRLALTHHQGKRVLLIGLGARDEFDSERARVAAATAHRRARELSTRTLCWEVPHHMPDEIVEGLVTGTVLSGYRFARYKPAPETDAPAQQLIMSAHHDVAPAVHRAWVMARAQNRARDLANTAPNHMTPAAMAERALELAVQHDSVEVTVLDGEEIRERGMGAFASVAQGTAEDARLIELRYEPGPEEGARLALIGKAVTFDTGGLTVKPPAQMPKMKFDMCGGAAVIETIGALAELGCRARVLGVVGACENMPSGRAVKPSDVVTALDGTTIAVDNPDAEGRLILADCITHARRAGCEAIVDIATLTGAVEGALGHVYAGLMSNDDDLADQVRECGRRTGEIVWRLPLHEGYLEQTRSRVAELTNRPEPRVGLASAAAEFLHQFAGEVPWAHIDMLGVAFGGPVPYVDREASGWGVRLLAELALGFTG